MISLFVTFSILTVVVAQQPLSCDYFFFETRYEILYTCSLSIDNPNGLNNFTDIGGNHFGGNTNANVQLIFKYGGITTNIPSIICAKFPNLIRVELYEIGVTTITDSSFAGCAQLKEINLSGNKITSISTNAFNNLGLTSLSIEKNLLATVSENLFLNQQSLEFVYMGNNPIANIPTGFFRHLPNLKAVYLSYCNLTAIDSQWFSSNERITELYLVGNRITEVPSNIAGLQRLNYLNLAGNQIRSIPAGTFVPLPLLKNLYLNNNSFTELQADSFPDLAVLDTLDISDNQIRYIRNNAFRGLNGLTTLIIGTSSISQLDSNAFAGLPSLIFLSLNNNQIEVLPQGVFTPLPNLHYIGLYKNGLTRLDGHSFGTVSSLRTFDLAENHINALDRSIIDNATILDMLYLGGNICENINFYNFSGNRAQYLQSLATCFANFHGGSKY